MKIEFTLAELGGIIIDAVAAGQHAPKPVDASHRGSTTTAAQAELQEAYSEVCEQLDQNAERVDSLERTVGKLRADLGDAEHSRDVALERAEKAERALEVSDRRAETLARQIKHGLGESGLGDPTESVVDDLEKQLAETTRELDAARAEIAKATRLELTDAELETLISELGIRSDQNGFAAANLRPIRDRLDALETKRKGIGAITVERCAHGNEPHDCDPCDVASDLAADAAREDRHFGGGRSRD